MRRFISFILLSFSLLAATPAFAGNRFIVRIDDGEEPVEQFFERLGLTPVRAIASGPQRTYLVTSASDLEESTLREILTPESRVVHFEEVRRHRLFGDDSYRPNRGVEETLRRAERFASELAGRSVSKRYVRYYGGKVRLDFLIQQARREMRLGIVHRRYGAGEGIVAVIDTGVDPEHPALAGALVAGYDFLRNRAGASEWNDLDPDSRASLQQSTVAVVDQSTVAVVDQSTVAVVDQSTVAVVDQKVADVLAHPQYRAFGHGTLVAGLVRLVAPKAKIMPLKAFASDGTGSSADIMRAIYYAVEHGADVINMSFSLESFSPEVMRAINFATRQGVLCASSAGNRGEAMMVYPASLANVTGVAGLTAMRTRSAISNYGEDLVSVATLGEEVLTTYPGERYASVYGTSFSTALVSGGMSVLKQVDPSLAQWEAEEALAMGRSRSGELGYGALDLLGALRWLENSGR